MRDLGLWPNKGIRIFFWSFNKTNSMSRFLIFLSIVLLTAMCNLKRDMKPPLKEKILTNEGFAHVKEKAREIVKTGFNAGDGYGEVWIRDYNTFIELSCEVYPKEEIRENLLVFFRMQGVDGNIIDGFIPKSRVHDGGYDYIYSELEPRYAGHKNTVETDQEASLVQAVYKYVTKTNDYQFLNEVVGSISVIDRLEQSLDFLMNHRYNEQYGLLWGATTADWGDVQPEHEWGVYLTDDTHYAIDIYDNAMFLIAIDNFMELAPGKKEKWQKTRNQIANNTRKHLWDVQNQKFIPHIYLGGSPFPDDFDENIVFYHGGTAIAIEAGLLSRDEIKISLEKMIANVQAVGAASIGLTMYPAYPEGFFRNKGMYPYGYQNGGDWTWFGGRMIQQLVRYGFIDEAYAQLIPMTDRVVKNDGFFEWYTIQNEPKGSGTFRGEAGVLYKAITMMEDWASKN
jgi:glycogen debranching enzyme